MRVQLRDFQIVVFEPVSEVVRASVLGASRACATTGTWTKTAGTPQVVRRKRMFYFGSIEFFR